MLAMGVTTAEDAAYLVTRENALNTCAPSASCWPRMFRERKAGRHLLERERHSVIAVGNGRAALAALGSEKFDLVLMDVQMPELDGLEATAAIRARERQDGAHIPIVAMTAHA